VVDLAKYADQRVRVRFQVLVLVYILVHLLLYASFIVSCSITPSNCAFVVRNCVRGVSLDLLLDKFK
jgi:hypothetical protein